MCLLGAQWFLWAKIKLINGKKVKNSEQGTKLMRVVINCKSLWIIKENRI